MTSPLPPKQLVYEYEYITTIINSLTRHLPILGVHQRGSFSVDTLLDLATKQFVSVKIL